MDGVGGYEGWRWIFILEGLLTVVVAFIAPFAIHDSPETATFLTEEERQFVIHSVHFQTSAGHDIGHVVEEEEIKFRPRYVIDALLDWQIYVALISMLFSFPRPTVPILIWRLVYWGITCPLYGISFFLPSIIKDLGYTSSTAQLLTVPIYVTAAIVAIAAAWISDRRRQRSPFILFFMFLIAMGFVTVLSSTGKGVPGVVYFGVFLAVIGRSPVIAP